VREGRVKVGILSDSHDNLGSAAEVLSVFLREGAQAVIHLGDVCSPRVLEPFRSSGFPLVGVFGNNDADRAGLQAASGNGFHRGPHVCEIGGRRILMSHTFVELQGEIGDGGKFDLILFGHTHRPLTMRVGRALVINPGEACGFMSGKATCAVVDLESMAAGIVDAAADACKGDARSPGAYGRR
jgi:putative phosphoesterase